MRSYFLFLIFFTLVHAAEEPFFEEESPKRAPKYEPTIIDTVHQVISADLRYKHTLINNDKKFFIPSNTPLSNSEFSKSQIFNILYPTASVSLFNFFFLEQSILPQSLLDYNDFALFDHFLFSSVVYNYEHLNFTMQNKELYDFRSHAIFYGLYVWEHKVESLNGTAFPQAPTADSVTVTNDQQGFFFSQIIRNMFNFIGMMTHSPDGIAWSEAIDKLPNSLWHLTFLPIVAGDVYTTQTKYSYTKNGTQLYEEDAAGWGFSIGGGFYLFSFDLFRTHYLNVSLVSSVYISIDQKFYTMQSGTRKGSSFYDQTSSLLTDSYLSLTF